MSLEESSSEPLFIFFLMTSEGNLDMSEHLKNTSIIWKVAWVVLFCFIASTTRLIPGVGNEFQPVKWPLCTMCWKHKIYDLWEFKQRIIEMIILFLLVNSSFLRLYISLLATVISGGRISALKKFSWVLTYLGHRTAKGFLVYVHY